MLGPVLLQVGHCLAGRSPSVVLGMATTLPEHLLQAEDSTQTEHLLPSAEPVFLLLAAAASPHTQYCLHDKSSPPNGGKSTHQH